ncbi:hypothetical protein HDF26_002937 [Pedobacter cryoconitis]|uniref:Uncharacterized protein n=1 Tax=Pedobacter cryoconitis TaxID=188932 RepID=A0A7W8ZID7_9SPHI|nr:DUF6326 family protein [Pedobacter cryoconitis]MBB5634395.1 hypothetical protein [Pedobacter cryoconitis]MBB6272480.1 hypothetical protein [Pedobacter cryoconitis]
MIKTRNGYQDFKINIKLKLSALWISVMFCYIYGDFFSLFVPGRIQGLINGQSGAGPTTPLVLLQYAILLSLPPLMIFLSLVLNPKVNRMVNIIAGLLFTIIMLLVVGSSISKWMIFYSYLGVLEIIITCLIVRYAWFWPRERHN